MQNVLFKTGISSTAHRTTYVYGRIFSRAAIRCRYESAKSFRVASVFLVESVVACTDIVSGSSASIRLYMLCQLVFPRPRHVVSEINPFFLGPGSVVDCPVTAGVYVTANLLDFFPIWLEFVASAELCARNKMNVIPRIDGVSQYERVISINE